MLQERVRQRIAEHFVGLSSGSKRHPRRRQGPQVEEFGGDAAETSKESYASHVVDTRRIDLCFPVAKVSELAARERRSAAAQPLPSFGKWWGRKPHSLIRAILLGCTPHEGDRESVLRRWMLALEQEELAKTDLSANPLGRVLDPFVGGGAVPWTCASLGVDFLASDLQPQSIFLTNASLQLGALSQDERQRLHGFLTLAYEEVQRRLHADGFTHDAGGRLMDMTLYHGRLRGVDCISSRRVDHRSKLSIIDGAFCTTDDPHAGGTVKHGRVLVDGEPVRFDHLRGDGLRPWDSEQVVGEQEEWQEIPWAIRVHEDGNRIWVVPTKDDVLRDQALTHFVERSLAGWFDEGLIPESAIPPGVETDRLSRERGWTHWHHLFAPRQLLQLVRFQEVIRSRARNEEERLVGALALGRMLNWNSRLCMWNRHLAKTEQTFANLALNPLSDFGVRSWPALKSAVLRKIPGHGGRTREASIADARSPGPAFDLCITDPPYDDAVHYDELSSFFSVWHQDFLPDAIPGESLESGDFATGLQESFQNLRARMRAGGRIVLMFAQNASSSWTDLAHAVEAAGLFVRAVWPVDLEPRPGLKRGRFGTLAVVVVLSIEEGPGAPDDPRAMALAAGLHDDDDPDRRAANLQACAGACALRRSALRGGDPSTHLRSILDELAV